MNIKKTLLVFSVVLGMSGSALGSGHCRQYYYTITCIPTEHDVEKAKDAEQTLGTGWERDRYILRYHKTLGAETSIHYRVCKTAAKKLGWDNNCQFKIYPNNVRSR